MAAGAKSTARRALYWMVSTLIWRAPRPRAMMRRGRPLDAQFSPAELLFFRCTLDGAETVTLPDGTSHRRVRPAHIHFPDQSVNREKYSRPWYVLLPNADQGSRDWIHWGVARVAVAALPPPQQSPGNVQYAFTVEHDPMEDNFGHCELRAYKDGQREKNKNKINATVKKTYRQLLSERTRVILEPLV